MCIDGVFRVGHNLGKHVFREHPGTQPDDEHTTRGQAEHRVLKNNPGDTNTQANAGFVYTGPDFGKRVFQENPGKRPDGERKNRGQVENRVLKKIRETPKHRQIQGLFTPAHILKNTFSRNIPENGPTSSAKKGVKSKIVF